MRSRVGVTLVCMYVYLYICQQTNRLFTALLLKNLPLSVFYYFLLE